MMLYDALIDEITFASRAATTARRRADSSSALLFDMPHHDFIILRAYRDVGLGKPQFIYIYDSSQMMILRY